MCIDKFLFFVTKEDKLVPVLVILVAKKVFLKYYLMPLKRNIILYSYLLEKSLIAVSLIISYWRLKN